MLILITVWLQLNTVIRTVWKLIFIYFWTHCSCICTGKGWLDKRFMQFCNPLGILQLDFQGTPEASATSIIRLLLLKWDFSSCFCNPMYSICLSESFFTVTLSAQSQKSLKISWNIQGFQTSSKAFNYFTLSSGKEIHLFPILLENGVLHNNVERLSLVVFPLIGLTCKTNYHKCARLISVLHKDPRHNIIHEFNWKIVFMVT